MRGNDRSGLRFHSTGEGGRHAAISATYGGPPPVQERYVEQERYGYQQPPQAYYQPAPPPVVYQDYAPPALVPVPEPYYVPQRRVYVDPGYGYGPYAYAPRPYVARGYGYNRPYYNHRRW